MGYPADLSHHADQKSDRGAEATTRVASKAPVRVCMHGLWSGRVNVRLMREAEALVAAGYQVTVVDIERDTSRPREETIENIHFKHVFMPSRFVKSRVKLWFLMKIASAVARGMLAVVRTPADIYHAGDDMALPASYIAAVLRHKKLIFDAYEVPLVQKTLTQRPLLSKLARWTLRRMMPRCDGIITVSAPIVDEIQRRYGGPRAVLVRNILPYTAPVASNRLRERLGIGPDIRIAIYQGGFEASRRLDLLVHAARYLSPQAHIVLLGWGECQQELEALIEQEGVGDRVTILPPVPYDALLSWTASADLGLIIYDGNYSPNVQFMLPNKLFEYLMAGVPVLASPLEATEELIQRYGVGVITPSIEPADIGQTISTVLSDEAALKRMRQNALSASAQELRWEVEQERLLLLYQNLLESSKLKSKRSPSFSPSGDPAPTAASSSASGARGSSHFPVKDTI